MSTIQMWSRKCQECNHIQTAIQPEYGAAITNSYSESKCKRCKSVALDYGQNRDYDLEGKKFIYPTYEE